MKKLIFFLAFNVFAQDLRYGGQETRKNIVGIITGPQCQLNIPGHNYLNGQLVYITQVTGVPAANGGFNISVVTPDVISLNIPCEGVWRSPSGYVGVAQKTSIKDFPRGPLDGPGGSFAATLTSKVVPGWAPYEALIKWADLISTQPYSQYYSWGTVMNGWGAKILMVAWKATGQQKYLDAALDHLKNFQAFADFDNFHCNEEDVTCGKSSGSALDWASYRIANFAFAFAIGGDQLSLVDQQIFANKMLNGYHGEPCILTPSKTTPWNNNCGAIWLLAHHTYQPNAITPGKSVNLTAAITSTTQTQISIQRSNEVKFPAYFLRGTEWMKMVSHAGGDKINVERGHFGTIPITHLNNALGRWTISKYGKTGTSYNLTSWAQGNQVDYDEAPFHNLVFSKHWAAIAVGIALGPIDPRAITLLERSWNEWYDSTRYYSKLMWTGLNQGGTAYGQDRWFDWTTEIAIWAKHSLSPTIDVVSGEYLKRANRWYPYFSIPAEPTRQIPFWDSGTENSMPARRTKGAIKAAFLFPDDPFVPYWEYFLRTATNYYTEATIYGGSELVVESFLYSSPNVTQTPLAQASKHYFFTGTDYQDSRYPGLGYNAVSSRNSWNPDATNVSSYCVSLATDHTGSYPVCGHYSIVKGNQWLIGSNSPAFLGSTSATLANATALRIASGANQLPTSAASTKTAANTYGQYGFFDRQVGSNNYVYWRANGTNSVRATAGVESYYRDFVHLISGAQDYLIVYDKVKLTVAKLIEWQTHHPTLAITGDTAITKSINGNLFTFTRGIKARINDKILLPTGPLTESNAMTTISGGTVTDGEYLAIHRASGNSTDVMPPIELFVAPEGFKGLEIEDETICRLVLIANGELKDTVTFTPNKCVNNAEVSITAFKEGKYDIKINGAFVLQGVETNKGFLQFNKSLPGEMIILPAVDTLPIPIPEPEFPSKCKIIPQGKDEFTVICKPMK